MIPYASRSQEEMKDVLMTPSASGPSIHYYMIRGGSEKKNITVWEAGKVGDEYIKTYGHYHVSNLEETYWILEGEGILLMQMRKKDAAGNFLNAELEWCKAVFLKAGDSYVIPPFAGHLMANIGKSWLVTADDSPVYDNDSSGAPKHADYAPVKRMRGFAYYIVEKNGQPEFVKNPAYQNPPAIVIEKI